MKEFWIDEANRLLDYINAAEVFGYQYSVERRRGSRIWHLTVYTDKFLQAAQEAANRTNKGDISGTQ